MPFYFRRNFYKTRKRYPWRQQRWFRRRRSTGPIRRKRRRRRVRRNKLKFKKLKLKKIKLVQWQPSHIKKCRIKGTFQLFQCGKGRASHNYQLFKESLVPPHEPGGGGWSYIYFSLNNLYTENKRLQNWWTRSNKGLPLCRFQGVKFKFYRQPFTDYIVTYSNEYPMEVGKYHYPSIHPQRMLTYNHRIIVPSYNTMPLWKKTYKKCFIKPPKEMIDKWYFQNHFQRYPLCMLAVTACNLLSLYVSPNALNNNCTVNALNTNLFKRKSFQYPSITTGYFPKASVYLYASPNGDDEITKIAIKEITYLGNPGPYFKGEPLGENTKTQYNKTKWGNPFHYDYMNQQRNIIISDKQWTYWFQNPGEKPKAGNIQSGEAQFYTEPLYYECRYNPSADTGDGNEAYWVSNLIEEDGWETQKDPDLIIRGFPLWILLWGWYDWTKKLDKIKHVENDYVLVVKTKFIKPVLPHYVFLSESFCMGLAPYKQPLHNMSPFELNHWYPRYKFQEEAIEQILNTGTGVCRFDHEQQIQAHCYYQFYFKWGGNPATFETVVDPTTQPYYPVPGGVVPANEIIDPSTSPLSFFYNFDTRRNLIKQTAIERIQNLTDLENFVFTDGTNHTDQTTETQETSPKTAQEKEAQKEILLQLQQYKLLNQQLLQRFQQLRQLVEDT
nr:MAG: ORF1 [TTV-like mini virus]